MKLRIVRYYSYSLFVSACVSVEIQGEAKSGVSDALAFRFTLFTTLVYYFSFLLHTLLLDKLCSNGQKGGNVSLPPRQFNSSLCLGEAERQPLACGSAPAVGQQGREAPEKRQRNSSLDRPSVGALLSASREPRRGWGWPGGFQSTSRVGGLTEVYRESLQDSRVV